MDICINELSLSGQYTSEQEYIEKGLFPMVEVLRGMDSSPYECYMISTLYGCHITPTDTLYSLLTASKLRQSDEIRRFKSLLAKKLSIGPYWDLAPKHSVTDCFKMGTKEIGGTSLAESCERDKVILSFSHNEFAGHCVEIFKNEFSVLLRNLFSITNLVELMREQGDISFKQYLAFQSRNSKLDFTKIDEREGFALISTQEESLFADAFRMFRELSWEDIRKPSGLDYKEYTNKQKDSVTILKSKRIHKFRIGQKYRCFGEEINGVFYVLMFDLTHKLSD